MSEAESSATWPPSLKAVGYREMQLGVDKGNPQSFAFWTKNGFEVLRENGYIVMRWEI